MISSNPIPQVCNYGSSASYCTCPSDEQIANGVVPLDSLPASWWNWMWSKTNTAVNCARYAAGVLIDEVNTVLTQAGVCVNPACVDQLYRAINNIRQTIGTADVAGAVKSSSTASEVAIDPTTGKMSVNCLGNAASLTTTATTVVGAINELKSTYDTCWSNNTTALSGKAPTSHASTANTYGVGSATNYGHLKISDVYNNSNCQGTDIAASQKAVYCAWKVASDAAAGNVSLGNTAGCALGTASAGTATTAARSDHVHPYPTYIECVRDATNSSCYSRMNYGAAGLTNPVWIAGWNGYELRAVCRATLSVGHAGSASRVSVESCTGVNNETLPIPLVHTSDPGCTGSYDLVMAGINSLRYNPYSGLMYLKSCFKTACIGHMNTSFLHIYTDAPEIAFNKSIYLPDGCYICRAKYSCCASYNGSGTAFGTAATCAATAFRASNWWPDSFTNGCVRCSCAACHARCASCALYHTLKGRWCLVCCPSQGCAYMRMYVCFAATGDYMIFPGGCFTYTPKVGSVVPASAMLASITTENAWTPVGPTYITACTCCVSPACTTTGDIPSIEVW